jgi:hypothetical protein
VRDEEFRRGEMDTGFIERFLARQAAAKEDEEDDPTFADIAAIAAILHAKSGPTNAQTPAPAQTESRWKLYGRLAQRR